MIRVFTGDLRKVPKQLSRTKLAVGILPMRWPVAVLAALLMTSGVNAQDSTHTEAERKVIRKVAPVYPDLARRIGVSGVVKLVAFVAPNGSVKSTEAVGGNPVLIRAAIDAVKEWKFAPAPNETREIIELRFSVH